LIPDDEISKEWQPWEAVAGGLDNVEKQGCALAKNQVCSVQNCPQNKYNRRCMELRGELS